MIKTSRAVPVNQQHSLNRGDVMAETKYDATYQVGNSTVHVISPGELTEHEIQIRRNQIKQAFLKSWKNLSLDKQNEINQRAESSG